MRLREEITELALLIRHYVKLLIKEVKLRQYEVISSLLAAMFATILLMTIIICALLVAIVSLCLWLSTLWDSYALGFAGGAGVMILLFFVLLWGRTFFLERPIRNTIVRIFTKE